MKEDAPPVKTASDEEVRRISRETMERNPELGKLLDIVNLSGEKTMTITRRPIEVYSTIESLIDNGDGYVGLIVDR